MLDNLFKFHKDTVLEVFCLQEGFPVNWAVEESREAKVPHQVVNVLLVEEVAVEIVSEVIYNSLEVLNLLMSCNQLCD